MPKKRYRPEQDFGSYHLEAKDPLPGAGQPTPKLVSRTRGSGTSGFSLTGVIDQRRGFKSGVLRGGEY